MQCGRRPSRAQPRPALPGDGEDLLWGGGRGIGGRAAVTGLQPVGARAQLACGQRAAALGALERDDAQGDRAGFDGDLAVAGQDAATACEAGRLLIPSISWAFPQSPATLLAANAWVCAPGSFRPCTCRYRVGRPGHRRHRRECAARRACQHYQCSSPSHRIPFALLRPAPRRREITDATQPVLPRLVVPRCAPALKRL